MDFLELPFIKQFITHCEDAWRQGWHESNGGNLSYRLTPEERDLVLGSRSSSDEIRSFDHPEPCCGERVDCRGEDTPNHFDSLRDACARYDDSALVDERSNACFEAVVTRKEDVIMQASAVEIDSSSSTSFRSDSGESHEWVVLEVPVPGLAGECFAVSATGSYFRSMRAAATNAIGVIQINETGAAWCRVAGFNGGSRPTSELPTHLRVHERRITSGDRIVYHAHPESLIAMSAMLPIDSAIFSRSLWTSLTETILLIPEGVGVAPWLVPGSEELATASAHLLASHRVAIWPHHGVLCSGPDFTWTFGLMEALEKAASIHLTTQAALGSATPTHTITSTQLHQAATAFKVTLNPNYA